MFKVNPNAKVEVNPNSCSKSKIKFSIRPTLEVQHRKHKGNPKHTKTTHEVMNNTPTSISTENNNLEVNRETKGLNTQVRHIGAIREEKKQNR